MDGDDIPVRAAFDIDPSVDRHAVIAAASHANFIVDRVDIKPARSGEFGISSENGMDRGDICKIGRVGVGDDLSTAVD